MTEPREYLVGIHEFIGRNVDELDIRKGEYVEVIEDDREFGDSWYIGRNLNTGKSGLFPKVFTASVVAPPRDVLEHAANFPDPEFVFGDTKEPQVEPSQASNQHAPATNNTPVPPTHQGLSGSKESVYDPESTGSDYGTTSNGTKPALSVDTSGHVPIQQQQNHSSTSLGGHLSASVTATMSDIDAAISEIAAQGPSLDAIGFWTPHDVQQYLLSRGYDATTAHAFVKHRITGLILLELDLAHLKEIDITSFGTRFEISKEIKYLNRVVEQTGQALPAATTPTLPEVSPIQNHSNSSDQPSTPLSAPNNVGWNGNGSHKLRSPFSDFPQTPSGDLSKPQSDLPALQSPLNPTTPTTSNTTTRRHKSMRSSEFEDLERCETPLSEASEHSTKQHVTAEVAEQTVSTPTNTTNPQAGNLSPAAAAAAAAWSPNTPTLQNQGSQFSYLSQHSGSSAGGHRSNNHNTRHARTTSQSSLEKPTSPLPGQSTPPVRPDRPKRNNTLKNFRSASSQYLRPNLVKQKTSAFTEGIQQTTAEESAQTAQCSGWMQKRGGMGVGTWKQRFFTLHGTRLSYFTAFTDDKERGLIDITGHRVMAAKENEDKLISLYAAGVGAGRYCFKLVPPAPGYRKGVSFTAPKTHYFACETKEEMRNWISALMKATIERDESVPVISSCTTPSVSLPRAQEIIAERLAAELSEESGEDTQSIPSSQPNTDTPPQTPAFSMQSSHSGSAGTGK